MDSTEDSAMNLPVEPPKLRDKGEDNGKDATCKNYT